MLLKFVIDNSNNFIVSFLQAFEHNLLQRNTIFDLKH